MSNCLPVLQMKKCDAEKRNDLPQIIFLDSSQTGCRHR